MSAGFASGRDGRAIVTDLRVGFCFSRVVARSDFLKTGELASQGEQTTGAEGWGASKTFFVDSGTNGRSGVIWASLLLLTRSVVSGHGGIASQNRIAF